MSSSTTKSAISKLATTISKCSSSPNSRRPAFTFKSPISYNSAIRRGESSSPRVSFLRGSVEKGSPSRKQTTPSKGSIPICCKLFDEESMYLSGDLVISTPVRNQLLIGGIDSLPQKPQVLGRGGFGTVILASQAGMRIALKVVRRNPKRRNSIELAIRSEKRAMLLDHPRLIRTFKVVDDTSDHTIQNALVFMEFAGSKNMLKVLEDPSETVSSSRRIKFALQLAEALNWCHYKNILHLDVKPANVIINEHDNCKLGDFGCSRDANEVTEPHQCSIIEGTIAYKAPELLQRMQPTFKADVYSFGITMWQLLTRKQPFAGIDPHVVLYRVATFKARPICHGLLREENLAFAELYEHCWETKEVERPYMSEAMARLMDMWMPHRK